MAREKQTSKTRSGTSRTSRRRTGSSRASTPARKTAGGARARRGSEKAPSREKMKESPAVLEQEVSEMGRPEDQPQSDVES